MNKNSFQVPSIVDREAALTLFLYSLDFMTNDMETPIRCHYVLNSMVGGKAEAEAV